MNLTGATPQELGNAGSLEELYRSLATVDMGPGWNKPTPSLYPEPRRNFRRRSGTTCRPRPRSIPPAG